MRDFGNRLLGTVVIGTFWFFFFCAFIFAGLFAGYVLAHSLAAWTGGPEMLVVLGTFLFFLFVLAPLAASRVDRIIRPYAIYYGWP